MADEPHHNVDAHRRLGGDDDLVIRDPWTGLDSADCPRCGCPVNMTGRRLWLGCPFCGWPGTPDGPEEEAR